MVTVEVLTGPPGSGKSSQMMQEMADIPGRYLWASPIIDLIDEQVPRMRELAPSASVIPIHSRAKLRGTVGRNISDLQAQFGPQAHVAAFSTHDGLLGADPEGLADWHVRIDETPDAVTSGVLKIAQSVDLLRASYDLQQMPGGGWSRAVPRNRKQTWADHKRDDISAKLVNFHSLATRKRGLLIGLEDWDDARNRDGVEWFSVWTPAELERSASITVTGAGYFNSLTHRVTEALFADRVQYTRRPAQNSVRTGQPRVHIRYFTRAHRGTTSFWSQSQGRWCLVNVCDWLAAHAPDLGYWSGNEIVQTLFEHRLPGTMVAPKLAGLNGLRHHKSCAFIYSSKPVPGDKPLKSLFALSDDDIIAARETEDVVQFVYRGAIRNTTYDGPYDIYLYQRDQALAVAAALAEYGLLDIEISPIADSEIMHTSRVGTAVSQQPAGPAKREKELEQGRVRSQRFRDRRKAMLQAA